MTPRRGVRGGCDTRAMPFRARSQVVLWTEFVQSLLAWLIDSGTFEVQCVPALNPSEIVLIQKFLCWFSGPLILCSVIVLMPQISVMVRPSHVISEAVFVQDGCKAELDSCKAELDSCKAESD